MSLTIGGPPLGSGSSSVVDALALLTLSACDDRSEPAPVTTTTPSGEVTTAPPAAAAERADHALVRFVHAVPAGAPVDLYADDRRTFDAVEYKSVAIPSAYDHRREALRGHRWRPIARASTTATTIRCSQWRCCGRAPGARPRSFKMIPPSAGGSRQATVIPGLPTATVSPVRNGFSRLARSKTPWHACCTSPFCECLDRIVAPAHERTRDGRASRLCGPGVGSCR